MSSDPRAIVWINGSIRPPEDAGVSWADHGLTVGDGVFETLKLRSGTPFAVRRHLDRLERSAVGMGLPVPDRSRIESAVTEVARAWGGDLGRLRITLTGGDGPMGSDRSGSEPTLLLVAVASSEPAAVSTVALVPWTRNERGALAGLKTTSYGENVVALAAAHAVGADEALCTNTVGALCEGTGSNVFAAIDGHVVTPSLRSGCLAGITRELVIESAAAHGLVIEEIDMTPEELLGADEVFLTSSIRDVQAVGRLLDLRHDTHPGPGGTPAVHEWPTPGPLTAACARAWSSAFGADGDSDP